MLYAFQTQVEHTETDAHRRTWFGSQQLPTCYVEASSPGEAVKKARALVNWTGDANAVHVDVVPVTLEEMTVIIQPHAA